VIIFSSYLIIKWQITILIIVMVGLELGIASFVQLQKQCFKVIFLNETRNIFSLEKEKKENL